MRPHGSQGQAGRRILQLAPDFAPGELALSSIEFFLLSRIDGCTPWRVLREMGGLSAEESDLCLESWLAAGYVELAHLEAIPGADEFAEARLRDTGPGSESRRFDASLDLDLAMQQRIVEFEKRLGGPDHLLLGVAKNADEKSVKRAHVKLSREFHPDRYFRRDLGPYRARLEALFKEIQRAYESYLRRSAGGFAQSADTAAQAETTQSVSPGPSSAPAATQLDRLSQRLADRLPDHVRHERQQKARELMVAAEQAASEGRLQEALTCLEIVTRFDPGNRSARGALADLQMKLGCRSEDVSAAAQKTQRSWVHRVSGADGARFEQDPKRGHQAG